MYCLTCFLFIFSFLFGRVSLKSSAVSSHKRSKKRAGSDAAGNQHPLENISLSTKSKLLGL